MKWLKSYPRVRTYSIKLDEKLKTVESELVKLGISEESMKPILVATGKLVNEAANILDLMDRTTNVIITADGKTIATVPPPDLKAYEKSLEEYRKLLLKHDCTEAAAKNIVEKFGQDVDPLLKSLSQAASKDNGEIKSSSILQLGTAALNKRIDKLIAELVVELFSDHVKWLVQEKKFIEAREVIWTNTSADDAALYAPICEVGHELMLKVVNPAHWTAITNEFAEKVKKTQEDSNYDEAIAWCEAYPDIRTFSSRIDGKLIGLQDQLVKLGVDTDKVQPIVDEALKAIVAMAYLADTTDTIKKTEGKEGDKKLPLEDYENLLTDYRTTLVRNGCTDENADKLVVNFKTKIAPFLAILAGAETGKDETLLGTSAINIRLQKLRVETIDTLKSQKYRYVFTDLIAKVSESVAAGKYTDARNYIRDVPLVQDAEWDARIYTTRIGLLNSTVNPNQCAALLKEIDAKAKEFFDAKKYEEFREYAKNYEYVHDTYKQIADALAQVKTAMVGLTIAEEDAGQYIDKLSIRIREMLEKRTGAYSVETDKDLSELEKALAELEKGIVTQYYRPDEVKKFCGKVKQEILSLIVKTSDPMTTWEMNEVLRARLANYLAKADTLSTTDAYAKLLAEIDAEVSFDSQIAMAEDAIAKQLGIQCPEANLNVNALLGEYARVMRLLKLGKELDPAQAIVLLLGGIYLEQSAVVTRALEFGADVNGVSSRDPLARTGVLLAIQTGHNSFLKQLSDAKASLSPTDVNGDTALHYAVRRDNLSVVKAMLAKNDVNKTNKAGETALFIAVRKNQVAVTSALISMKADVTAKNAQGETVMDAACFAGSRDVLDLLASAGAAYGPDQLKIAAKKDHIAVAQWLVGKCVDVNAPGVMEATVSQTDTQRYLVHEGGVLKSCEKDSCIPAASASGGASPKNVSNVSGTIKTKVSETK